MARESLLFSTSVGVALGLSGLSLLVSLGALGASWMQARRAHALSALVDLFREYRALEPSRRNIFTRLDPADPEVAPDVPITKIQDAELRRDIVTVIHFLDNLGVLLKERYVKAEVIAGFVGSSVQRLWDTLESNIRAEEQWRRERGFIDPPYQRYFEHLTYAIRQVDVDKQRSKLSRMIDADASGGAHGGGDGSAP